MCDWAFSFVGEFTNLFHCWLEWGNKVPTVAPEGEVGNNAWGMYTPRVFGIPIPFLPFLNLPIDKVGTGHGDREGDVAFWLPDKCCCRIKNNPPESDPFWRFHIYIIGNGTCNTVLWRYLEKVCPEVANGPSPASFSGHDPMLGWGAKSTWDVLKGMWNWFWGIWR